MYSKPETFTYTFRQERQNMEKVEICAYTHEYDGDGGSREPLLVLPESEIDALWTDILALDCHEFILLDSILSYGSLVITITYINGEIEMIGIYNIGWISADGTLTTTLQRFGITEICAIIIKYADEKILSEYSDYLRD